MEGARDAQTLSPILSSKIDLITYDTDLQSIQSLPLASAFIALISSSVISIASVLFIAFET